MKYSFHHFVILNFWSSSTKTGCTLCKVSILGVGKAIRREEGGERDEFKCSLLTKE